MVENSLRPYEDIEPEVEKQVNAAEQAGLRRGDLLVHLGTHAIGSVEDLMYALNASKPGETVTAQFIRDGRELRVQVTFQQGRR